MAKRKSEDRRQMLLDGQDLGDDDQGITEGATADPNTPPPTAQADPQAGGAGEEDEPPVTGLEGTPDDDAAEDVGSEVDDEAQVTEQTPSPTLLEQLAEMGFKDLEDEAEAPKRLLEAYRTAAEQMQQLRQEQEQLKHWAQIGREFYKPPEQQQPAAPEQKGDKPDSWWSPPQFDPTWLQRYREAKVNERGETVYAWKENTPAEVRANTEKYQEYLDDWSEKLVSRPHEVLPQIIRQEAERLIEDRLSELQQKQSTQTFMEQVKEENRDWLFQRDPLTNQFDESKLTPEGRLMDEFLQQAFERGITEPRYQWEYASLKLQNTRQQNGAQSSSAREVAAEKRQQHLRQAAAQSAASTPAQRGAVRRQPGSSRPSTRNDNLSPGQRLVEQLVADGEI